MDEVGSGPAAAAAKTEPMEVEGQPRLPAPTKVEEGQPRATAAKEEGAGS